MVNNGSKSPNSRKHLPILRVTTEDILLPSGHLQLKAFDFFNEINFIFNSEEGIEKSYLEDFPVLLIKSGRQRYEIVGGFRSFSIARQNKIETINAYVIEEMELLDLQKICLDFLLEPLIYWAFDAKKFEATLKRFLKATSAEYPKLKEHVSQYFNAVKNLSRFKSRKAKKYTSEVLSKVEQR